MIIGRRGFLAGLGALMAAPAIVSVANIMPVKVMPAALDEFDPVYLRFDGQVSQDLSDIVQTTLRNRSKQIADNITKNNAILSRWQQAEDARMFGDLRQDILNAWVTA